MPDQPKLLLILVDVERERHGRNHLVVGGPFERAWLIALLELLVSGSYLTEIQRKHELTNIPFMLRRCQSSRWWSTTYERSEMIRSGRDQKRPRGVQPRGVSVSY